METEKIQGILQLIERERRVIEDDIKSCDNILQKMPNNETVANALMELKSNLKIVELLQSRILYFVDCQ
jgi:hypothetical protein